LRSNANSVYRVPIGSTRSGRVGFGWQFGEDVGVGCFKTCSLDVYRCSHIVALIN
jgi:hypothetical protein